jgi:hypothetical protein
MFWYISFVRSAQDGERGFPRAIPMLTGIEKVDDTDYGSRKFSPMAKQLGIIVRLTPFARGG